MPFAATRMDLEIVLLSEVRERQIYDITDMCNLKKMGNGTNLLTKEKQNHICRKLIEEEGRDKLGGWN